MTVLLGSMGNAWHGTSASQPQEQQKPDAERAEHLHLSVDHAACASHNSNVRQSVQCLLRQLRTDLSCTDLIYQELGRIDVIII